MGYINYWDFLNPYKVFADRIFLILLQEGTEILIYLLYRHFKVCLIFISEWLLALHENTIYGWCQREAYHYWKDFLKKK